MTLIGFVIDVSSPTGVVPWVDTGNQAITRTEFFNGVSAPTLNNAGVPVTGTLVRVIYDRNTNFILQARLED